MSIAAAAAPQPTTQLVKVLNASEIHKDFLYETGLNELDRAFDASPDPSFNCSKNGLYYTSAAGVANFLEYGDHLREVTLPEDAKRVWFPESHKGRCDKMILGEKKWPLGERATVDRFHLNPWLLIPKYPKLLDLFTGDELAAFQWHESSGLHECLAQMTFESAHFLGRNKLVAKRIVAAILEEHQWPGAKTCTTLNFLVALHPNENWSDVVKLYVHRRPSGLRIMPYLRAYPQRFLDCLMLESTTQFGRWGKYMWAAGNCLNTNRLFLEAVFDSIEAEEAKQDAAAATAPVAPVAAAATPAMDHLEDEKAPAAVIAPAPETKAAEAPLTFAEIKNHIETHRDAWIVEMKKDVVFLKSIFSKIHQWSALSGERGISAEVEYIWDVYFEFVVALRADLHLHTATLGLARDDWLRLHQYGYDLEWLLKYRELCPKNVISRITAVPVPESLEALRTFLMTHNMLARAGAEQQLQFIAREEFLNLDIRAARFQVPLSFTHCGYSTVNDGDLVMEFKCGQARCLLALGRSRAPDRVHPTYPHVLFVSHERYSEIALPPPDAAQSSSSSISSASGSPPSTTVTM